MVPHPPKSKEDRVKETVHILNQLKEAGVSERGSYIVLKEEMTKWINTGEAWSGKIPFPEYGRVAEVVLPSSSKHTATLAFKLVNPPRGKK
jgi:hypothetical protein